MGNDNDIRFYEADNLAKAAFRARDGGKNDNIPVSILQKRIRKRNFSKLTRNYFLPMGKKVPLTYSERDMKKGMLLFARDSLLRELL